MENGRPIAFVLFGATGDLAVRKIVPALGALHAAGELPKDMRIIAFSRRPWDRRAYHDFIQPSLKVLASDKADSFFSRVEYVEGTFDNAASFEALKKEVDEADAYYHLAIQPEFYEEVIRNISAAGLRGSLLIEKPFGRDAASAAALEALIEETFLPERVHRIDHYLGKSGLDALIVRRRTDEVFEQSLSKKHIALVECRILESLGIEGRGEFYDATGALRDVGQNHLLQMLATLLMDMPERVSDIPSARAKALKSLMLHAAHARGQYEGYEEEEGVRAGSQTETYFKLEARSSAERWQNVPLLLEVGKALTDKRSEIEITYADGSHEIFVMDLPDARDAYEVIIGAILTGDTSRSAGREEVETAWAFAEPVAHALKRTPLVRYPRGRRP